MRPGGWLLNFLYTALLFAASPVIVYRRFRHGKYRGGWGQKLVGQVPLRSGSGTCVWFHAVSVGEVLLLQPVRAALRKRNPDLEIWISTTTDTGHAVARERFPDDVVLYFPLDFTWAVRRAIRRVRPNLIALVELELWPNFITAAHSAGVPLVLLNGRMSERSFRGYRRLGGLVRRWLERFSLLTAQTEEYAERLRQLGAPRERTVVTGSVKYDGLQSDRNNPRTRSLREAFEIADNEVVFIAGSTQAPEEQVAIDTWLALQGEFPQLRLLIVPRHRERFEDVAQLVMNRGLPLRRRSGFTSPAGGALADRPVLLLDTLGELAACWGLADMAFVGGSLSRRGGQNMLEPAAYGAAVMFGPNTFHFRHAVELLLSRDAARVVHSRDDLTQAVRSLLASPDVRREMGERARELVLSQQGATEKTVALLENLLREPRPRRHAA